MKGSASRRHRMDSDNIPRVKFSGRWYYFATLRGRRAAFQKERDKRPETWNWDWHDRPRDAIRQILGYVLGESPPRGPPDPEGKTASA